MPVEPLYEPPRFVVLRADGDAWEIWWTGDDRTEALIETRLRPSVFVDTRVEDDD